ncbi:MAG: hypothetical protein IKC82_03685 [Lentisphaeria bacterium]|nr:hypothetical protein [Lentisphaeria bacterium]
MSKTPEITWSLMHPTPLDVEYMKQVVAKAAEYKVDSFELCAACHGNYGGMDGLADYSCYPHAFKAIDQSQIQKSRAELTEIVALAHSINKPLFYWHREAMVPDGLLEDLPHLLDANGEFDLLGAAYEELLRYKINASFEAVPALDGLVLTLTEATYSVIHSSAPDKYPPRQVVEHIVRIFADELGKRGKRFILRSFGSIAQDYEDIIAGAREAAKDYPFEIETKITPYDFDPFLPVNPFLRKQPGATLGAECDCLGEFLGAGMLPAENVDNIVMYVRNGQAADVDRYAIRLDRIGNKTFDCYEVNLYAYTRAITDNSATAEQIRKEYLEKHAPASQREIFGQLDIKGFELVKKTNFVDGNVIFHQFPSQKTLKYLKAGFIFALFKNGVSLINGKEVWSILFNNNTPGRDAILEEKRQAVEIADWGNAMLDKLSAEPGFEFELAWRKRLWSNAAAATRAFYELTKCICAYFDDMEKGDECGTALKAAAASGKAELSRLAGCDLSGEAISKEFFENGLGSRLFRAANDVRDIYLNQFYAIFGLLEMEYEVEFAMRKKYSSGCIDCIIAGGITDEWRIERYMHAAHSTVNDGEIFRFAGNTVFPNGYLKMLLKRGSKLVIYGDTTETADFCIELDNGVKKQLSFDADNRAEIAIPAGEGDLLVKLTKAPGVIFPRFRAICSIA